MIFRVLSVAKNCLRPESTSLKQTQEVKVRTKNSRKF